MRAKNLAMAKELMKEGEIEKASKKFAESVTITSYLKFSFLKVIREMGIEFIVAPYEADSQMAYLFKTKRVQLVITEDSDLIAFGVRKLLFKMNTDGIGQEIDIANLKFVDSLKFDYDMLLTTCILSGCDYLKSIKGIGFKTANKLINRLLKDSDSEVLGYQ